MSHPLTLLFALRIVVTSAFGQIKNEYEDYLGTGEPLQTEDGVRFVIKPKERIVLNLEFAQGIGDSRGVNLKLGYAW